MAVQLHQQHSQTMETKIMSKESNIENAVVTEQKQYHSPVLTNYGKMSELTQTIQGDTGDDGGGVPSSYTAST